MLLRIGPLQGQHWSVRIGRYSAVYRPIMKRQAPMRITAIAATLTFRRHQGATMVPTRRVATAEPDPTTTRRATWVLVHV